MTTNHTPGPWVAYEIPAGTPRLFDVESWRVGDARHSVAKICLSGSNSRDAANARLIAEAPAMLEALRVAQEYLVRFADMNGEPDDGDCVRTIGRIAQILARIEGA